jgi:DNA-binding NarL/FixJ family response regulator
LKASFSNAEDALQKISLILPDIVLMDIHLGNGKNGIECVQALKLKHKDILFMMCTIYQDDEKIFDALKAGASGYVLKKATPYQLLEAIKELYEGGAPMSSQIAMKVVSMFQAGKVSEPGVNSFPNKLVKNLSLRETEILHLLASGMLYKEIANHLGISPETVRKHAYNVYEKLHVDNRVQAINKFFHR